MIIPQGFLIHHLQRIHLAQMEMGIDKGFSDQVPLGVNFDLCLVANLLRDRYDIPGSDPNFKSFFRLAAQLSLADQNIKSFSHGLASLNNPSIPHRQVYSFGAVRWASRPDTQRVIDSIGDGRNRGHHSMLDRKSTRLNSSHGSISYA